MKKIKKWSEGDDKDCMAKIEELVDSYNEMREELDIIKEIMRNIKIVEKKRG